MIIAASIVAALAALLHVYIFVMESITWTSPKTRGTFGLSADEAHATRQMAFNQGFYNLFLAVVTAVGIVMLLAGATAAGVALVFAGIGSMAAAALVLLLSDPSKRSAALKQGTLPLLGVILLVIAVLL